MKEKLLELLWDLENYKYPNYDKKADEILRLFSVSGCLPSNKEVINKAKGKYPYKKTKEGTYYEGKCKGFIEGANWMKWKHENINNR